MLEKDHEFRPSFDDRERRLLRVATKGVVTLFNAVQKAQKKAAQESEDSGPVKTETFLNQLKKESIKSESGVKVKQEPVESDVHREAEGGEPKWAVLKENFLLGGKLTDWDKESESEDDED